MCSHALSTDAQAAVGPRAVGWTKSPQNRFWLIEQLIVFITVRSQCAMVNDILSDVKFSSTGTPQGCVRAPLLFMQYTNECKSQHAGRHISHFRCRFVDCVPFGQQRTWPQPRCIWKIHFSIQIPSCYSVFKWLSVISRAYLLFLFTLFIVVVYFQGLKNTAFSPPLPL